MKRALAVVLAGCLVLQPLPGYSLAAESPEPGIVLVEDSTEAAAGDSAGMENWQESVVPEITVSPEGEIPDASGSENETPGLDESADIPADDAGIQEPTDGEVTGDEAAGNAAGDVAGDVAGDESAGDAAGDVPGSDGQTTEEGMPEEVIPGDMLPDDDFVLDDVVIVDDAGAGEVEYVPEPESETEPGSEPGAEAESETEFESESEISLEDLTGGIQTVSLDEWEESYIEVKVAATLPFLDTEEVTIALTPASEGASNCPARTVKIAVWDAAAGKKIPGASEKFAVAPGKYTVTLTAKQFAAYTQEVEVGLHETSKIEVSTSKLPSAEGVSAKSGWMRLGDVTGDGEITQDDVDALLSALRLDTANTECDLNANGVVDLADLQLAVLSKDDSQVATVVKCAVPKHVEHDEKTVIENLDNLLYDNGTTTLRPADGEKITPENPVSIAFDFGTTAVDGEEQVETKLPELEGMTLQAPVEQDEKSGALSSDITGGSVIVEAEENGKTVRYEIPLIAGTEPAEPQEQPAAIAEEQPAADAGEQPAEAAGEEAAEDLSAQEEAASIMLMTVGAPADMITIDSMEEIDEAEVPAEAAADNAAVAEPDAEQPEEEAPAETKKLNPAKLEMDGSFVLDFGSKIAVKRITICITGTKQTEPLAQIAKVQFVNDMADRIPAPNLNIPEIGTIVSRNEELEVPWTEQTNVTGYEIEISGPVKKAEPQTQIVRVTSSPHTISSINDKPLINYKDYSIRIRSVNGEWSSPWTDVTVAQPKPESAPDRVDNVVAKGGFRSVQVSWKDMDDANGYMLFYREKGEETYKPVLEGYELPQDGADRLMQNSYTITGLKDLTTYELYVIAWNDYNHGAWGDNHPGTNAGPRVAEAVTESGDTPRLPKYHLINKYNGSYDDKAEGAVGRLTDHIVSAVCGTHNGQTMVESALDQEKETKEGLYPKVNGKQRQYARWALGTVDNSYTSYWTKKDWDDGVSYPVGDFSKGVTVTFDQPYKMNYLTFTAADLQGNVETAQIVYWKDKTEIDADLGGETVGCSVVRNLDETNRPYYVVKFDETVTAQQIHLYIGTTYANIELKIAEIHFHNYDETVDGAVKALFADEMHSMLSEELAALAATDKEAALAKIDEVQAIVETKDEATGEYHPLKDFLLLDLEGARELVNLQLDEPFYVDNTITAAKDGHINFGGLNEWQPLGRVAASGEKLIVYVGHNAKSIGQTSNLRLYCTQYHAESNALANHYTLKVGKNEITLKQVTSTGGKERAGQLYIAYTGNNPKDQYVVRINGGAKIPVLNIYNKSEAEKKAAISKYVTELGEYVTKIESEHTRLHYNEEEAAKKDKNGASTSYVYFPYDKQNCFLNATDLMADHMMYSVPATQIWDALKNYSTDAEKAAAVESAMDAMEKTMTLFYQHKGLFKGAGGNRETPSRHLNIRYMQMFSGAFMYASGNHIGVEFPQTALAMSTSWNGYGWGVAHEIGHDINDPNYAIAEITNNYFAQLLTKAANANHATRFNYEDVYEKVTSGAIGRSPNGAVQLALYWQLHLAFDDYTEKAADGYRDDRYIFDEYQQMFDNLFFARVDTYSRNPGQAPKNADKNKAVELKMVKDIDQNLMRLACAAAGAKGANILPFFERWGMVPDEDTKAFAAQYGDPVEKAYYYVNDDARNYRVDHKTQEDTLKVTGAKASVTVDSEKTGDNRVVLNLSTNAEHKDAILGYEVIRSTYWRGKKQDAEVIGFKLADADGSATYTDVIAALDNRVLYYEVRAVDKFLNYSQLSDTVSARVSTGGALGKNMWSVETTITAAEGQDEELKGDDHPDGGFDGDNSTPAIKYGISKVIDNKVNDAEVGPFRGTAAVDDTIIIDMQKMMEVTSVQYAGKALGSVTISVSSDGSNWATVKEKYTVNGPEEGKLYETIWLDAARAEDRDYWIGTYDARYVRFVLHDPQEVEIDEINICGPSGDDVSFYEDAKLSVGLAAETYTYAYDENGAALTIPAGALIFTGGYKGNPAYNMVMLYDDAVTETEDGSVRHGNVVGADLETGKVYAEQVILAAVPAKGNLGETSDGSWVYFVTPENESDWTDEAKVREHSQKVYEGILKEGNGKVRAELYRVDNAITLEGERIVSDTAFLTVPGSFSDLNEIELKITVPERS